MSQVASDAFRPRHPASAITPYTDRRKQIRAFFSIWCPNQLGACKTSSRRAAHSSPTAFSAGNSMTKFSSGPDSFALSQSWGVSLTAFARLKLSDARLPSRIVEELIALARIPWRRNATGVGSRICDLQRLFESARDDRHGCCVKLFPLQSSRLSACCCLSFVHSYHRSHIYVSSLVQCSLPSIMPSVFAVSFRSLVSAEAFCSAVPIVLTKAGLLSLLAHFLLSVSY